MENNFYIVAVMLFEKTRMLKPRASHKCMKIAIKVLSTGLFNKAKCSVTRLGELLDFGQLFKAFDNK